MWSRKDHGVVMIRSQEAYPQVASAPGDHLRARLCYVCPLWYTQSYNNTGTNVEFRPFMKIENGVEISTGPQAAPTPIYTGRLITLLL